MKCDSCPNDVPGARYGHDFDPHNQEFYELHVYFSHPVEDAERIIAEYYERFPNKLTAPGYKVTRREL